MKNVNLLIAAFLLMAASVAQAAEIAGNVGYMSGKLIAQRADGTIKVMGPQSEVLAGDTLVTAKDSYVQMKMKDGAKMTLRPNSTLKIEDYRFNRQEPKADNAVFRLLKGGFRTVTGLIGKRGDPDAYKVRAVSATIGIRGTDFTTRLCATPNCLDDTSRQSLQTPATPLQMALDAMQSPPVWKLAALPLTALFMPATAENPPASPPGLYVTVHSGQVIMAQAGNMLNLASGQTGFASAAALSMLPATPQFMKTDTKQTDAVDAKASKQEEKSGTKPDDGGNGDAPGKEKDDSGSDEKSGDKPDEEKGGDEKAGDEKADSKSDGEKSDSKTEEGEKDGAKQGDTKQEDAKPGDSGKSESAAPEEMNSDSSNPSINKSGCVVR